MLAIRLSDFIEGLQHLSRMKRLPGGRARASDRAVLRVSGTDLKVDLPRGGTMIPVQGGNLEGEAALTIPALEALHKGLLKYEKENPLVILSIQEASLVIQCEKLKVRLPLKSG